MKIRKKRMSGTLATAVSRWRQKWSVPSLAEPSPRTLPRGVRISMRGPLEANEEADHPDHHGQTERPDDVGNGELGRKFLLEAIAEVPHEVAEAAEHVVQQRPGIAEEHELADKAAEYPVGPIIGALATCGRD